MADSFPEIQRSFVQKFLKSKVGENIIFSSNYVQDFSKSLTLFMLYLTTVAQEHSRFKHKTVTVEDVKKAFEEIGFEDLKEELETINIRDMPVRRRKAAQTKNAKEGEEAQFEEIIENDDYNGEMDMVINEEQVLSDEEVVVGGDKDQEKVNVEEVQGGEVEME